MSRHNRRRTRGGHKMSGMPGHQRTFDLSSDLEPSGSSEPPKLLSPMAGPSRRNSLSARHWHNRYTAWQARERKQRDESDRLEAEKRRIFGDTTGDREDDNLCVKMMEYFGGLDFIEE